MPQVLINGQSYGWSSISVKFLGRLVEGITAISYTTTREKTNNNGRGGVPVSRGRGSKTYEASMTLEMKEVRAIIASLPKGKDLTDIAPFEVVVSYIDAANLLVQDTLHNFEFTTHPQTAAEGDASILIELPGIISGISYK